eukprot:6151794-Amphidinium_carterae.1
MDVLMLMIAQGKKGSFMVKYDMPLTVERLNMLQTTKGRWERDLKKLSVSCQFYPSDKPPRLEMKGNVDNMQKAVEAVNQASRPLPEPISVAEPGASSSSRDRGSA